MNFTAPWKIRGEPAPVMTPNVLVLLIFRLPLSGLLKLG